MKGKHKYKERVKADKKELQKDKEKKRVEDVLLPSEKKTLHG